MALSTSLKHEDYRHRITQKIFSYAAAFFGRISLAFDDILDADDFNREEDGISGEELNAIEQDDLEMAAALNAVETDRLVDAENLPEESDEDDYYDNDEVKEEEERV